MTSDPEGVMPSDRMHLLKDALRLQPPFHNFVVYDNCGFLGVRLLAKGGGPSVAGVDLPFPHPHELGGVKPAAVYFETVKRGLPDRRSYGHHPLLSSCGASAPEWMVGSREGLIADVKAIAWKTADHFSVDLAGGVLMLWILSQNENSEVGFSPDPSDMVRGGALFDQSVDARAWLMEDILRLSVGIFRRNLPVGCSSNQNFPWGHRHDPVRFMVPVLFERQTGHDAMSCRARYDEIVASTLAA